MPDSSIPLPIGGDTIYAGWGNTVRLTVHDLSVGHKHDGVLSRQIGYTDLTGIPDLVKGIVHEGILINTITFIEGTNVTIDVSGQTMTFSSEGTTIDDRKGIDTIASGETIDTGLGTVPSFS